MARIAAWVSGIAAGLLAVALLVLGFGPEPAPQDPPPEQQAKAAEILADPTWAPPAGWAWGEYARPDGTTLRYGRTQGAGAAAGRVTFVYVPGYTGIIEQNYPLLRRLAAAGVDVYSVEARGQGGSTRPLPNPKDREKTHITDFKIHSDDIAAFLKDVVRPAAPGAVVLGGISMGGHIVARTAMETPEAAEGYALVSPAVLFRTAPLSPGQARLLAGVMTTIGAGEHYMITHGPRRWPAERLDGVGSCGGDPERGAMLTAWNVVNPETRAAGGTYAWLGAFLDGTRALNEPANIARLTKPVLLINPQLDDYVVPEASSQLCSALSDCVEIKLADGHHCPFEDPDSVSERAYAALRTFLEGYAEAVVTPVALEAPALGAAPREAAP